MPSVTKFPTSTINGGGGNPSWTNPNNVQANDGSGATSAIIAAQFTKFLITTGYEFDIPTNATITGCTIVWERHDEAAGESTGEQINILRPGDEDVATDYGEATAWPAAATVKETAITTLPTVADVNDETFFGVRIRASGPCTPNIDYISIKIDYTLAGIGSANFNRFLCPGAR